MKDGRRDQTGKRLEGHSAGRYGHHERKGLLSHFTVLNMRRGLAALALLALPLVALVLGLAGTASAAAIISNGTVTLGVNDEGHLNVETGGSTLFAAMPSLGGGPVGLMDTAGTPNHTLWVGLRRTSTQAEATSRGCLCEGWGAGVSASGVSGYANIAVGGVTNLTLVSFTSSASTATSVVRIKDSYSADVLEVTHYYHPSASSDLYQVDVTIKNVSGGALADLRYRRVMDWDIEPTPFNELVTIGGLPATNVLFTNDNGFATANPLGSTGSDLYSCGVTVNFTDCGIPGAGAYGSDHGALFNFGFSGLADGETRTFKTYYGVAATEAGALAALAAVGAEVYSLGQCDAATDPACSSVTGVPNTFIFAFGDVGGTPVTPVPEPGTLLLLGSGVAGILAARRRMKRTR